MKHLLWVLKMLLIGASGLFAGYSITRVAVETFAPQDRTAVLVVACGMSSVVLLAKSDGSVDIIKIPEEDEPRDALFARARKLPKDSRIFLHSGCPTRVTSTAL